MAFSMFDYGPAIAQGSGQYGSVYDPRKEYARYSTQVSSPFARQGMSGEAQDFASNYVQSVNQDRQNQQNFMQQLLRGIGGFGQGAGQGSGGDPFGAAKGFAEEQAGRFGPKFDEAVGIGREKLRREILSQGGASALSSGQAQDALARFESGAAGEKSAFLGGAIRDIFSPTIAGEYGLKQSQAEQPMRNLQMMLQLLGAFGK